MLEALGISAELETLYLTLARFNRVTVDELAQQTGSTAEAVRAQLERMRQLGLAVEGSNRSWQALGLLDVVESLRRQRLSEIEAAAMAAETLNGRLLAAAESDSDSVQTLVGLDSTMAAVREVTNRAGYEICGFDRPPYGNWVDINLEALQRESPEWQALQRGVRLRSVYHPGFDQKRLELLTMFTYHGEEARMGYVPLKMIVVDSRVAVVPSTRTYHDGREVRASLIRNPLLVQSLQTMFDEVWDQSVPLAATRLGRQGNDPRREVLVSLLMAGSTDQAIATQLRVNERSVRRWIAELMSELGVQTRLQLGMALVHAEQVLLDHDGLVGNDRRSAPTDAAAS